MCGLRVFDEAPPQGFVARLREFRIRVSEIEGGKIVLSTVAGVFETEYSLNTLVKLQNPCFLAVKSPESQDQYLIYEVFRYSPTHYQQLTLGVDMPKSLRKDFLEKIFEGWREGEETWIDIHAVYTGYCMRVVGDQLVFERRRRVVPLIGAEAKPLSIEAIDRFVNADEGVELGQIIGLDLPLRVRLDRMIRYHCGVFGFTGVGKSNLTSILLRKALHHIPNLKVVILDVSGEYAIHLIDLLAQSGVLLSTERFDRAEDPVEAFLASQAIPDTLLEKIAPSEDESLSTLRRCASPIVENSLFIDLMAVSEAVTLEWVLDNLEQLARDQVTSTAAKSTKVLMDVSDILRSEGISPDTPIAKVSKSALSKIKEVLESSLEDATRKMSTTISSVLDVIDKVVEGVEAEKTAGAVTPEDVAEKVLTDSDAFANKKLVVCYVPEPLDAREFASRLINSMFTLRKRMLRGPRVLVVVDEAQEFIPDSHRKEDKTLESNQAVERLLRQGRKYGLHGILSSQRVAHLNVNAIQQVHTYFAGVLPRVYDRGVVAEAAGIPVEFLDEVTELDVGEWLYTSHVATKIRGVPIFVKTPDNEEVVATEISSTKIGFK